MVATGFAMLVVELFSEPCVTAAAAPSRLPFVFDRGYRNARRGLDL
jgi:hypothetical protein